MRIVCPHCGVRSVEEFECRGSAPIAGGSVFERVYERVNTPHQSLEHWQHVHGCRMWLALSRNPSTGEVLTVRELGVMP